MNSYVTVILSLLLTSSIVLETEALFKFDDPFFNSFFRGGCEDPVSIEASIRSPFHRLGSLQNSQGIPLLSSKKLGNRLGYPISRERNRRLTPHSAQLLRDHFLPHSMKLRNGPLFAERAPIFRALNQFKQEPPQLRQKRAPFIGSHSRRFSPSTWERKNEHKSVDATTTTRVEQERAKLYEEKAKVSPSVMSAESDTGRPTASHEDTNHRESSTASAQEDVNNNYGDNLSIVDEDSVDDLMVNDEENEWPTEAKGRWASEGYVNNRGEFVRY